MRWKARLIWAALAVFLPAAGWAQAPPDGDGSAPEVSSAPVRTATIPLGDDETRTYRGVLVEVDFWIGLPDSWELAKDGKLEIVFAHSPVLIERLSSMTASVNGNAVDSVFLNVQSAKEGRVSWAVRPEYLKLGHQNKISITAKMRSDLELCDDVHSPALWMTLRKGTRLVLEYTDREVELDISRFPSSYLRPEVAFDADGPQAPHAVIVVPTAPGPHVLDGIGVVAARLGVSARFFRGKLDVAAVDELNADVRERLSRHNLILLGPTDFAQKFVDQGLEAAALVRLAGEGGRGYLIEARNPWNPARRALLITGADDAEVAKSIAALSLPHLSEQWAVREDDPPRKSVSFAEAPTAPPAASAKSSGTATLSLAELGSSDMTVRGKFHHYLRVAFPNPYVGRIESPAIIRFILNHSELLLPQTSSLLVKLNGSPARSMRLSPRTARRLEGDVIIPEEYLGDRMLVADLEFFLDIGDPDCHYNFPEMAWATLHNESFIQFPLSDAQTTSLRSYPWVISKESDLNGLVFVVAEQPTDEELAAVANIAAFLGTSLPRFGDSRGQVSVRWVRPAVKRIGAFDDADTGARDLMVIGGYELVQSNSDILKSVPESLFTDAPSQAADQPLSGDDFASEAGWVHLAASPWNSARSLLVVSGARGASAVSSAAEYLWVRSKVDQLGGSTVFVGPNGAMQIHTVAPGEEPRASPQGPVVPNIPPSSTDPRSDVVAAVAGGSGQGGSDSAGGATSGSGRGRSSAGSSAPPTSRHQVAYLVFVILGLLLVVLVVVRIRDAVRSET